MVATPSRTSYRTLRSMGSRVLPEAEDVLGDDHALDLGGALADLRELGVAEDALDGEFRDVAGASVDLKRRGRCLHGDLGGEQLRHGGRRLRRLARVLEGGRAQSEEPG